MHPSHIQGESIHSSLQLENNSIKVDDHPAALGGSQSLSTIKGCIIPMEFVSPFTDDELNSFPHVIMAHDAPWSPRIHDSIDHVYNNPCFDDSIQEYGLCSLSMPHLQCQHAYDAVYDKNKH